MAAIFSGRIFSPYDPARAPCPIARADTHRVPLTLMGMTHSAHGPHGRYGQSCPPAHMTHDVQARACLYVYGSD
jgi:hypothetical protein